MMFELQGFEFFLRVFIAFLFGAMIGWEREKHGKHAGIRTYGAICLGSCLFGLISQSVGHADEARIAAQVVSGIGFLGAGVIFQAGDTLEGLTTAAGLWVTASIGLAVSFGLYFIALLCTLMLFSILYMPEMAWWGKVSAKRKREGEKNKSKILTK